MAHFELRARNRILKRGYEQKPSEYVPGVIDTSAPIVRNSIAAAALTSAISRVYCPRKIAQGIRRLHRRCGGSYLKRITSKRPAGLIS